MTARQPSFSRRSAVIAAALLCTVSLAIGANAALNKRSLEAPKSAAAEQGVEGGDREQDDARLRDRTGDGELLRLRARRA